MDKSKGALTPNYLAAIPVNYACTSSVKMLFL